MIIISKKRIEIIISCLIIGLFTFSFGVANKQEKNSSKNQIEELTNNNSVETVAVPISGKTIVVDARTWCSDEGAQSSRGTTEAETNLKIALKLQNLLEQGGSTVVLTRSDENAIYDVDSKTLKQKKISDIHNRVKIGNESQADIFVSIHLNKIPQSQYWGWQCFYNSKNENSVKLAKSLQTNLNDAIQEDNKRVAMKLDTVYIMKHVEIPISIVECGFLSNPEEENKLLQDEYQDKLAWGIYNGIIDYFFEK